VDKVISIDKKGRIVLPLWIRAKFKTRKVLLKSKDKVIVIEPVKNVDEIFGSLKGLDVKEFSKEHKKER
jgi:DNA-binding transcriptional regulator/RsmH inhibitor MraZ